MLQLLCVGFILLVKPLVSATPTEGTETPTQRNACFPTKNQRFLSVLPGAGWDNLVNQERGLTTDRDVYDECRMSPDGSYLIPDNVVVEPVKSSRITLSSEVFSHFTEYTTLTAQSMNVGSGFTVSFATISGDFSMEKESVRNAENENNGLIVRSQLRHRLYVVHQLPDAKLHPRLRNRLIDIAAHIARSNVSDINSMGFFFGADGIKGHRDLNSSLKSKSSDGRETLQQDFNHMMDVMRAAYLADLVVRDFGTHAIVSVEAGALVAKIDSLTSSTRKLSTEDRLKLKTGAAVSFAGVFSVNTSMQTEDKDKMVDEYSSKVATTMLMSHGGPSLLVSEMDLHQWEENIQENLVAIDRRGISIYDIITPRALPEISESLALKLAGVIKAAVERYYAANTVVGCLDPKSPAYDSDANVATDHCDETSFNDPLSSNETSQLPFGGVYTSCIGPNDLCSPHVVKNPATGATSCPVGYRSVGLLPPQMRSCAINCVRESIFSSPKCVKECAFTLAAWCAVDPDWKGEHRELGFLFGGLYTDRQVNPMTNSQSCPMYYEVFPLGRQLRVCLSTDREFGRRYSLSFGGFYACQSGNPLVDVLSVNKTVWNARLNLVSRNKINDWVADTPKRCPTGYTSHMASMEDTCQPELNNDANFALDRPLSLYNPMSQHEYVYDDGVWVLKPDERKNSQGEFDYRAFLIVGCLGIFCLAVAAIVAIVLWVISRKGRGIKCLSTSEDQTPPALME